MAISAESITKSSTLEQLRTQFNNLVSDLTALEAGKAAFTEISTTTITGTAINVAEDGTIVFEGGTNDEFETTLTVVDPTADRTISLPNTSGVVVVSGDGSFTVADGGTVGSTTTPAAITIASNGNITLSGDLTISGDDLTMGTNTAGHLLIADGTNFNPTAVTDLTAIGSGDIVSGTDVLVLGDVSAGTLKKVTVDNVFSSVGGLASVAGDSTPQLGGDLDGQGRNLDDIGTIDAEAFSNSYGPTGSPVTFTVTVASKTTAHPYYGDESGNMYLLDGVAGAAPILGGFDATTANSEYFYKFDQSDSSNSGHPLRFYLDADKTTQYTTGVTTSGTPGNSGAHTTIQINEETPRVLYYQCSSHNLMGNYILMPQSNVSNSFEKLIAMPTHDSGTLKIDGTVLMDSSDGTADAGDHIVQNTSANENDNILLEDGMHDPVGVLSSHGVTLSGTTFTATGLSAGATTLSSTLAVTGAITASSTFTGGGLMTTGGNIVIPNAGNIGSVGDTDAIAIASNGVVTFSQNPVFPDGGIAIADLDIDGASDIGADLASTDLIIVDDGAGGTNRKAALSRVVTLTDAGATALAIALG
jgi:hypothetical protein